MLHKEQQKDPRNPILDICNIRIMKYSKCLLQYWILAIQFSIRGTRYCIRPAISVSIPLVFNMLCESALECWEIPSGEQTLNSVHLTQFRIIANVGLCSKIWSLFWYKKCGNPGVVWVLFHHKHLQCMMVYNRMLVY